MNTRLNFFTLFISTVLTMGMITAQDCALDARTQLDLTQSALNLGIKSFLTEVFNDSRYAAHILPNNFFHFIELLDYGSKNNKPYSYMLSIVRLFTNKLKACRYVNGYEYYTMLIQLNPIVERYFNPKRKFDSPRDLIFHMIYPALEGRWTEFINEPKAFLRDLSHQMNDALELRKALMLFFEVSLNKLVWSPEDQVDTWNCVKSIATELGALQPHSVIVDTDDLNNLYITLLERYCLFMELTGMQLSDSVYDAITQDINIHNLPWLELEEQDALLETKAQRLDHCVRFNQDKMRMLTHARQLVDAIPESPQEV